MDCSSHTTQAPEVFVFHVKSCLLELNRYETADYYQDVTSGDNKTYALYHFKHLHPFSIC